MMFANMSVFKNSMLQAKDNARELSRIGGSTARTFEQTSRDNATRLGSDNTNNTTKVYVQREEQEQSRLYFLKISCTLLFKNTFWITSKF